MKYSRNPVPTFTVFKDSPRDPINGVGRLPAALTINSITEYPVFRYTAGGGMATTAFWDPWGYGETLDIAGAGDLPTPNSGSPLMGPMDNAILGVGAKYYEAAGALFADVTTEDIVLEVVLKMPTVVTAQSVLGKYSTTGWKLITLNNYLYLWHSDGTAASPACLLAPGQWNHIIYFADRSGVTGVYVNGVYAATNTGMRSGSLTNAGKLRFLAADSGATTGCLAYAAMWKQASWLDTHLQATVAKKSYCACRSRIFTYYFNNHIFRSDISKGIT